MNKTLLTKNLNRDKIYKYNTNKSFYETINRISLSKNYKKYKCIEFNIHSSFKIGTNKIHLNFSKFLFLSWINFTIIYKNYLYYYDNDNLFYIHNKLNCFNIRLTSVINNITNCYVRLHYKSANSKIMCRRYEQFDDYINNYITVDKNYNFISNKYFTSKLILLILF